MKRTMPRRGQKPLLIAILVFAVIAALVGGIALGQRVQIDRQGADGDEKRTAAEKNDPGVVVDLGEFLVNITSADRLRYLRTEISLRCTGIAADGKGAHGDEEPEMPEGAVAIARDRIIAILAASSFDELQTGEGREALKKQLLETLKKDLPEYEVRDVLFTSFVMQ